MPEASTRMSTAPKRCTAAATILSQCAAELGRKLRLSTLAPSFSHSAATFLSASAPPAARTRLQPAPARTCAASAPKAPVAPVTIAVLPLTSNSDNGFFRTSSGIDLLFCFLLSSRASRQGVGAKWPIQPHVARAQGCIHEAVKFPSGLALLAP